MMMDMCIPKFDIYQVTVAPVCFKSHTKFWCPDFIQENDSETSLLTLKDSTNIITAYQI